MELQVLNQNGSGENTVPLSDAVFQQDFNEDLVHQLVNTYIHNSHQRTKVKRIDLPSEVVERNLGSKREPVELEQERSDLLYGVVEV